MAKLVADTYGQALFELALKSNALDAVADEVAFVRTIILENKELLTILTHPKIGTQEKINVVENIFKGKVSDMIMGLMVTMIDKSRAGSIVKVFDYFLESADEYRLIGHADVISAMELTQDFKEKINAKLIATTKYKSFKIKYTVDEDIIGGLIIRIGDRVVDSSVRTKLDKISKELLSVNV